MPDRFEKYNESARLVLARAQEEAQRHNQRFIGTEHILLGLTRDDSTVAAQILNEMGVPLLKIRSAVEFIISRGDRAVMGEIGLTPCARTVIELTFDQARLMNCDYIGPEHILLGLVAEGEGIAAGVLKSLNVELEDTHQRVKQAIDRTGK